MKLYDNNPKKDWHTKKGNPSKKKSGQTATAKRCEKRRKTRARRLLKTTNFFTL